MAKTKINTMAEELKTRTVARITNAYVTKTHPRKIKKKKLNPGFRKQ